MRIKLSANVTLWVNRVIAVGMTAALLFLEEVLEFYIMANHLTEVKGLVLKFGYYCCFPVVMLALFKIDVLLRAILRGEVFTRKNVSCIRYIRWCCLAVSLICLPAAFRYMPLFFVVIIMGFLCLVVSVVVNVMKAAVEIREENDLTI